MLKGLKAKKEKAITRNKIMYERKNITGKAEYIVKVVDQPLIKLVLRLKDKSSKISYNYSK